MRVDESGHGSEQPPKTTWPRPVRPSREAASDMDLLHRWADGDRAAAAELFDRHVEVLTRFFRNKVSDAVDDLVHTTFLACLERPRGFAGRSSFRSYLLSVARFTLYRHYRNVGRLTNRAGFNTTSRFHLGPSPSVVAVREQEDDNLLRALRHIPLDHQLVLELLYWEEMSCAEIAQVLDVPVNTVYNRVHRAKQRLRVALEALDSPTSGA